MTMRGLLCVSFVVVTCAMPMAAQSWQSNGPFTGAPLGGTIQIQDSRGRIPALGSKLLGEPLKVIPDSGVVLQLRPLDGRELQRLGSQAKPQLLARVDVSQIQARLDALMAQVKLHGPMHPAVCYAMRDYEMERTEPGGDTTRLNGWSNCMPAAQVHTKTIVK